MRSGAVCHVRHLSDRFGPRLCENSVESNFLGVLDPLARSLKRNLGSSVRLTFRLALTAMSFHTASAKSGRSRPTAFRWTIGSGDRLL